MIRAKCFALAWVVALCVGGLAAHRDGNAATRRGLIQRPDRVRSTPVPEGILPGETPEETLGTEVVIVARTARASGNVTESVSESDPEKGPIELQEPSSWTRLLQENLRASGIDDPAERALYEKRFEEKLGPLIAKLSKVRNEISRARKLHEGLHKTLLRRYKVTSDGLDAVLDRGEYNCVSATLLYGMAARAIGLQPSVVESPRHIFIRLDFEGRDIDVETTSPRGFELRRDLEMFRRFVLAYKYATPDEVMRNGLRTIFEEFHGLSKPVGLERATAFLWHNTGERALERGDALVAATSFGEEFRLYPELAVRGERIGFYLARAFRIEYEEGRFETAFRIAEIETRIFPGRTSARDRFLAAATKRIQGACEDSDSLKAEDVLYAVASVISEPEDMHRLERETCPRIAAAAVRSGDWECAQRMAERFAVAEPDAVEATRFLSWLESRRIDGPTYALEEACSDYRRPGNTSGSGVYGSSSVRP